jgi:trehalose 6-phosphate phosphatase
MTPSATPENYTTLTDVTRFFLGVDGTLLDLAASPTAVVVPRGLVDCIASIEGALGGALALISGRTLGDLDQLFWPPRLRASGVHGAQIRSWRGAAGLTPVLAVFFDEVVVAV